MGGSSGSPVLAQEGGQLAGRRWPCSLPGRYLLACGGVPGRSASPGAVSPHSCPCWLFSRAPCTEGDGMVRCSAVLPRTAASQVNGSDRPASGASRSPPCGALYPSAGFATNFAGKEKEGGGRLPNTVPGGRARGARDGAWLETSSAEGAERGGGHRRCYSRLARGSQLGPAPRSLSLTCLTPPQPSPAPCRRLAVPAPPPPPAPGAHVTDGTAPSGRAWFSHWFPPGCVPPLGPTQTGARPAAGLPGSWAGNYSPSMAPGCVPSSRLRSLSHRPDSGPRPLGRDRPIPPWNCLAWSRQARDPGSAPPPQPSPGDWLRRRVR